MVGLLSVRGTATSGYIQSNRSYVCPSSARHRTHQHRNQQEVELGEEGLRGKRKTRQWDRSNSSEKTRRNQEIIEHENKRQLES